MSIPTGDTLFHRATIEKIAEHREAHPDIALSKASPRRSHIVCVYVCVRACVCVCVCVSLRELILSPFGPLVCKITNGLILWLQRSGTDTILYHILPETPNGKVIKTQGNITHKRAFPAGHHKAARNSQDSIKETNVKHK